jgi:uncharacterized protein (TIGR04540 family)
MIKGKQVTQMEIKSFYKNQRELAEALSRVIDKYWCSEIPENEMIDSVKRIVETMSPKYSGFLW